MDGARQRFDREAQQRVHLAWVTAALSRAKAMPSYEKLIGHRSTGAAFIVQSLNAALPKITMAEYLARKQNGIVRHRQPEG